MARVFVGASFLLGFLAFQSAALAQSQAVTDALALYEDLRFSEALAAFEAALEQPNNRPADLATIHLHLGLIHGAEDREDRAESHFARALAVDPLVELPPGQPPKITGPFSRARQTWGEARLRIDHDVPSDWSVGTPATLRFDVVDDVLEMTAGARLTIWSETDETERTYRQDGAGPFIFPVPPALLEQESTVHYRVDLLGTRAAVLASLDNTAANAVVVGPAPPPGTRIRTVTVTPERRWYQQWWFWTIVGVVVAGAAAGTAVALTVPQDGIEFGSPEVAF